MSKISKLLLRILSLVVLAAAVVANGSIDFGDEPWYARAAFIVLFVFGFLGAAQLFRTTYHKDQLDAAGSSTSMKAFWIVTFVALVIIGVVQLSGYLTF